MNAPQTKCETCDQEIHDAEDAEGCINGIVYGYCSDDECYGYCETYGQCECSCHLRDQRGFVIRQVPDRPSVWP